MNNILDYISEKQNLLNERNNLKKQSKSNRTKAIKEITENIHKHNETIKDCLAVSSNDLLREIIRLEKYRHGEQFDLQCIATCENVSSNDLEKFISGNKTLKFTVMISLVDPDWGSYGDTYLIKEEYVKGSTVLPNGDLAKNGVSYTKFYEEVRPQNIYLSNGIYLHFNMKEITDKKNLDTSTPDLLIKAILNIANRKLVK